MKKNQKLPAQILKLKPIRRTAKNCKARAKELEANLKRGKYKGTAKHLAERYVKFYNYLARTA